MSYWFGGQTSEKALENKMMKLLEGIMEKMNNSSLTEIQSTSGDIINYVNEKYEVDIADHIMKEWTENGFG